MKKKFLALLLCVSTLASLSFGCVKKENLSEEETISEKLSDYYHMVANTNSCLDLYPGQFYVWHNPNAESITEDLLDTPEAIEKRFKNYKDYIFKAVFFDTATFNNQGSAYGQTLFGSNNRVAWFTDETLVGVPILYKGSKLIYYTNADVPSEFVIEKFDDLGYSIGACGFMMDESQHCYIPINQGGYYSESSDFYKVYSDITTNENSAATKLIIDNINEQWVSEDYIGEKHNVLLGLIPNQKYIFDIYYGTVHTSYELCADSITLASAEEGHHVTSNYELYNSTIAVIDLPSDMEDGYYYINNMGFFYYTSLEQEAFEAAQQNTAK